MHILIDLDDVIIKSSYKDSLGRTVFYWVKNIEKHYGITNEQIHMMANGWLEVMIGKKSLKKHVSEFLHNIHSNVSADDFISVWMNYKNKLNQDVKNWVNFMSNRGHILYIVTDQENMRPTHIIKQHSKFFKNFKKIYTSADIGFCKSQEQFFLNILNDLQIKPTEAILIDDNDNNLISAQNVEIKTVKYITGQPLPIF